MRPLSAPISAQKAIFSAFESAPWIPSAVEPACGATKSQLHRPPRTGRKKKQKWLGALFSLCIIFASLLRACLALCVAQVNERKVVCVCGAWKICFEASSFPAPTWVFGARLDRSRAAGTYQISHTGQAPARVVWMTFAC
jgi:hypothetical protein